MQSLMQFLHTVLNNPIQPAIQWLRAWFISILASPNRWIVYVLGAGIALLLIFVPLLRMRGRPRRRSEAFDEVRSYSVLGIGPAPLEGHADVDDVIRPVESYPRWADTAPLSDRRISEPMSNVRPIRSSRNLNCTHCGGALSAQQDFCPACGYAQPAKHSVTA